MALLKDNSAATDRVKNISTPLFMVCAIVVTLLTFDIVPNIESKASTIVAVATALMVLVISTNSKPILDAILGNAVLSYFGKISYGLYLYHFPIAAILYMNGVARPKMFIVCVFASIPIADFSFRFIESPIMRIGKKRRAATATPLQSQIV
jgi:peptidoglycan/LPS O-acetylase OafA/YrhL